MPQQCLFLNDNTLHENDNTLHDNDNTLHKNGNTLNESDYLYVGCGYTQYNKN